MTKYKEFERCKTCGKGLRGNNKSGYCSNCYLTKIEREKRKNGNK